MKRSVQPAMLLALFALVACGDRPADEPDPLNPPDGEDTLQGAVDPTANGQSDSVRIYFTRNEETVEVRRPVSTGPADIRATLERLLAGPTPAEEAEGITSWFGDRTAGMLQSVTIENGSHAIVDFGDLRQVIPNASSSTGSLLLMQELNATVFQFPELHSVEYRIDGSCAAFWEWLQYECHTVTRPSS